MPINSLGVGSGLELGNLVDGLVAVERQASEAPLNRRQAKAELNFSAIGSLRSSVDGLIAALSSLENSGVGRSVSSSFPEAVTATASDTAEFGSYLINVSQVAVAQSLATDSGNQFADADASLGEGTLTVTVGDTTVEIELSAEGDSLNYVREQINASDLGIQAAIVQDGDAYNLLLTSGQTGTDGAMSLTVDGTVDTRLASANMEQTTAAQDAAFTVNGLSLTSSSNTVEGVLPEITLDLLADTGGQSVVLEITSDSDGLGSSLAAFVTAYNALATNMTALGGASPDGSSAGPLVGDASLRALQRQIGSIFSTGFETGVEDNPFSTLVSIGIKTNQAGKAVLDPAALSAALAENQAGVEALVAAVVENFGEKIESFGGSTGILAFRGDQLGAELRRIAEQREDLDRRMSEVEARLVAKFSALDSLVAQFNNTSSFLTQQLANLSSIANYRRNNS